MPTYQTPGVYVEETSGGSRPVSPVGTSTAAFVGHAPRRDVAPLEPTMIVNWLEFRRRFVDDERGEPVGASTPLVLAVHGFFANGGARCWIVNLGSATGPLPPDAMQALARVDDVQIVAAPGFADPVSHDALLSHCESSGDRVAVLDGPEQVEDLMALTRVGSDSEPASPETADADGGDDAPAPRSARSSAPPAGLRPRSSPNGHGAFYVPWLRVADPLDGGVVTCPPSGHVAGIWARTDAERGVHKAPANTQVRGAVGLQTRIGASEQAPLNEAGVNCIRTFPEEGTLVWGARTLAPASSEWRYLNVRRLFTMIEQSIARGTRWIVFEPNGLMLWKSVERDIGAFLTMLWRDGALAGATAAEAFFVKCDAETNPPESVDLGRVVTLVGVAPLKPAEFVIFRVSQHEAGVELEGGRA